MTAPFDVDAFGVRVRVHGTGVPAADGVLRAAWAGALSTGRGDVEREVHLRTDEPFDAAMERITVDVTLAALEARRGRALMFHAGGVADPQGRVAAFVGPSGRGKTTLSRQLGTHFGYVSDETIAVDAEHRVQAYRKPLSLVRDAAPKQQVSPEQAGLRSLPDAPLQLGALVILDRADEYKTPTLEAMSLVDALPELVTQMSYLCAHAEPLQRIARLCDAVGGVRRLRYAEASDVVALMPEVFQPSAHASPWRSWPRQTSAGPFTTDAVSDAIISDGAVMVMVGDRLQVLGGVAPIIWQAAAAGSDLDAIAEDVVEAHGLPPRGDARVLVGEALAQLLEAGALSRR